MIRIYIIYINKIFLTRFLNYSFAVWGVEHLLMASKAVVELESAGMLNHFVSTGKQLKTMHLELFLIKSISKNVFKGLKIRE